MKSTKKILAFMTAILFVLSIIPMGSLAEETEDDTLFFEQIDQAWTVLEQAEANAIAQGLDKEGVISAVKQAAMNCEYIDSSSIQDCTSSEGFLFSTALGGQCMYDGMYDEVDIMREEEIYNQISNNPELTAEMMEMYQADMAQARSTSTSLTNNDSARNVVLIQPFVDIYEEMDKTYHIFEDVNTDQTKSLTFNSYFRNIAAKIAEYTGGTYTLLYGKNATVDAIAEALDTNAIVLFITHGLYEDDRNIIKLATREGINSDEFDGSKPIDDDFSARASNNGAAFIDATFLVPKTRSTFVENSIFWMGTCHSMKGNPGTNEKLLSKWLIEHGADYVFGITDVTDTRYQGEYVKAFFDSLIDNESSALTAFCMADGKGYYTEINEKGEVITGYPAVAYEVQNGVTQVFSNAPIESDSDGSQKKAREDAANNSILSTWKLIKSTDITIDSSTVPLYEEVSSIESGESYLLTYEDENDNAYAVSSVLGEMSLGSSSSSTYQNSYPYIMEVEKTENTTDNTVSFSVKDSSAECGTNVQAFELQVFNSVTNPNNVLLFNETVQKYLAIGTENKPTYTQNKYEWQVSNGKLKAASSNNTYVVPQTTAVPYHSCYQPAPHANGIINIDRLVSINSTDSEFQFTLYKRVNPDENLVAGKVFNVDTDVNYRQGPGSDYAKVVGNETLDLDTDLVVCDSCQDWWYVSPAHDFSVKGWIHEDYVSVTGEVNTVISTARANKSSKLTKGMDSRCGNNASISQSSNLNIYYVEGEWCYASTIADTSVKGWIPRADLDFYWTYPISDVVESIANTAMLHYTSLESMPTSITFNGMTLNSSAITLLMARTLLALENGETQVRVEESFNEMPAQTYQNYLTYNSFDSSEINKAGYLYAAQKCVEYYNQYHRLPNYVMFPGSSNLQGYNGRFSSLLANIVFVKAVHRANTQLPGSVETSTNYYQAPSSSAKPSPVPTEPPALSMNLQSGGSTFTVLEIAQAATGILEHYERYAAYPGEYSVAKGVVIKRGDTEYCITDQDWAYMAGYALAGYTGSWSASNLSGYTLDTEIVYRKANKPARSANATYAVGINATPTSVSADKVVEMAWKGSDYADEKRAVGEGTTMSGCCYSAFSGYQVTYYSILIASARMLKYIADNNGNLPQSVAYNAIDYKVTDTDTWGAL